MACDILDNLNNIQKQHTIHLAFKWKEAVLGWFPIQINIYATWKAYVLNSDIKVQE